MSNHGSSVAKDVPGGQVAPEGEHPALVLLRHIEAQPYLACERGAGDCDCARWGERLEGCLWSYWKRQGDASAAATASPTDRQP